MKSTLTKNNNVFICETTFESNGKQFTYLSKFKSDLKGVAYQELKTDAIEKEVLNTFKLLGCKNIETELKTFGYEVDANELLEERRKMLEKARQDDVEPTTAVDRMKKAAEMVKKLETELELWKTKMEELKIELENEINEEEIELKKRIQEIKDLKKSTK